MAWDEIRELFSTGSSVVYQHFRREPRETFIHRMAAELQRHTSSNFVEAFRTARVVFFLVAQQQHCEVFKLATAERLPAWHGQIDTVGLSRW